MVVEYSTVRQTGRVCYYSSFLFMCMSGMVIDYREDTVTDAWHHLNTLLTSLPSLTTPFQQAIDVLNECFDKYR